MAVATFSHAAVAVARGCGKREQGGVYLEVGISPYGKPLEDFLVDPPRVVDQLHLPPRGVTLEQRGSVWHVFDRVGLAHYPNVMDVLEEGRKFGFSRRVQKTLDFSKLTADSRLLLVHPRGHIDNPADLWKWFTLPRACPTGAHDEATKTAPGTCCCAFWKYDIDPKTMLLQHAGSYGRGVVKLPSMSYEAVRRPDGFEPQYREAIIASLPISRIVVVKGEGANAAMNLASKAKLPIDLVQE